MSFSERMLFSTSTRESRGGSYGSLSWT